MECNFSDFHGKCEMFDPDVDGFGCDKKGNCICEDDEDPTILCSTYSCRGCDNGPCTCDDDEYNEEEY